MNHSVDSLGLGAQLQHMCVFYECEHFVFEEHRHW